MSGYIFKSQPGPVAKNVILGLTAGDQEGGESSGENRDEDD